jgi:predicted ATPase
LAEQLLHLAQRLGDPLRLLRAHFTLGTSLFYMGQFATALTQYERGIALHVPQACGAPAPLEGQDPGISCRVYAAHTLCLLGYLDQALRRSHEALSLSRELDHPFSLAFALNQTARVHQYRREVQATQELAETLITLATKHRFAQWVATGKLLRGWVLAEQGQGEEGITQMCQGMAAYRATGSQLGLPHYLLLLAEAYTKVGRIKEADTVSAEALAVVHKTGGRYCEAGLYGLKGELLLGQAREGGSGSAPVQEEAEAWLRRACEMASQQGAKLVELRAAMSLSRLWQWQGKHAEARELLAPIYSWFTEGFDTPDLQEAKALLEALGT